MMFIDSTGVYGSTIDDIRDQLDSFQDNTYVENGANFGSLHRGIQNDTQFSNNSKWEELFSISLIMTIINVIIEIVTIQ